MAIFSTLGGIEKRCCSLARRLEQRGALFDPTTGAAMPTFDILSHTPPGKPKTPNNELAVARALIEADQSRRYVEPPDGAHAPSNDPGDGLDSYTTEDRLLDLDPVVRYSLLMRELRTLFSGLLSMQLRRTEPG
jgi:hypothetical protein